MSRLLEFFLGSILIAVFTVALIFFSALHYLLKAGGSVDCAWHGSARTWLDSNGDGLVSQDEPPLANVEIHVENVDQQLADVGWPATTDKDGDVQFNIPIPGCSNTLFEIYADIPEGYRMTTRSRVQVSGDFWGSLGPENIYYFGFISEK